MFGTGRDPQLLAPVDPKLDTDVERNHDNKRTVERVMFRWKA